MVSPSIDGRVENRADHPCLISLTVFNLEVWFWVWLLLFGGVVLGVATCREDEM